MIASNNKNIKITLPKRQADWLEITCIKLGITKSEYIKRMLSKQLDQIYRSMDQETLDELIRIAHTRWLDLDE